MLDTNRKEIRSLYVFIIKNSITTNDFLVVLIRMGLFFFQECVLIHLKTLQP